MMKTVTLRIDVPKDMSYGAIHNMLGDMTDDLASMNTGVADKVARADYATWPNDIGSIHCWRPQRR